MICPHCQSENREGAKFCNECGAPLLADAGKTQALGAVDAHTADVSADTLAESAEIDEAPGNEEELIDEIEEVEDDEEPADHERAGSESAHLDEVLPRIDASDLDAGTSDDLSSDKTQVINLDAAQTADFSGFERLVDSSYVPPARSWRSGDTMELPKIEGEPAPKQKTYEAPSAEKERNGKRVKRIVITVAVLLVVAAAALASTYYLELWGGKTIPDVAGEAQADAAWMLESKGFTVAATQVKSDEVEGIVLITDPASGSRVPDGTTVTMSIATPRAVPDVSGMSQDEAKAAFDKEGLKNVSFQTVKSDEAEGSVVELSPEAGTKVKAATAITVTIAEAYTVPDVSGKSQDAAETALKEAGYSVDVATKYSEDVSEGTVVSSDPAAGTKLKSGSTVTISVAKSRAKELVAETQAYFSKGATVVIGGVNCEIVSCDSVSYEGDGVVSYTITAKKFETTSLFGTLFTQPEQMSGTITWNSNNSIASASPKLSK